MIKYSPEELPQISAEVIDLRTIKPLDAEMIVDSVKKPGKALVLDAGWSMCEV